LSASPGKISYGDSDDDGDDLDIYTIDASGGKPFNVTNNTALNEFDPTFSPDGKKIAYEEGGPQRDFQIYTIDVTGGTPFQVINNISRSTQDPSPSWYR
jgi:Tol biopolymer transport system component